MKASINWLKKYIDLEGLTPEEIADKLTFAGVESEGVFRLANATGLVIGEILSCEAHPDSDHLHILQVDEGKEFGVHQIVCGAPNARKGLKVIVAREGAVLPEVTIKKGVIRGVESDGMCCSLVELGVDKKFLSEAQTAGIEELPADAPVGEKNVLEYLGLDDVVIDLDLLANRPDLYAINNIAREIGTLYEKEVKIPEPKERKLLKSDFEVGSTSEKCPQFSIRVVKNIKVGPSPKWLSSALTSEGIRSINNIVDIGNYIMLMTGQPLNMYDYDKLPKKSLIVRDDLEGEFVAMDEKSYPLEKGDLVVTSDGRPMCLAGIMTALECTIDENTKNVAVEAAYFDGARIRRTSNRIGLASDSSMRFCKGINPNQSEYVLGLTVDLLEELCGASEIYESKVYDVIKHEKKLIKTSLGYINGRLGTAFSEEEVLHTLTSDGLKLIEKKGEEYTFEIPSYRIDMDGEADISEEVIRIRGYQNVISALPTTELMLQGLTPKQEKKREIRSYLRANGLDEVLSYTLVSKKLNDSFAYLEKGECHVLKNPMTEDREIVRRNLLPSLLQILSYNVGHQNKDLSFFEISDVDPVGKKGLHIGLVLTGEKYEQGLMKHEPYDFYDMKGYIEGILSILGLTKNRYQIVKWSLGGEEFHPGRSAELRMGKTLLGVFGEAHPLLLKELGVKNAVFCELDLAALLDLKTSPIKASIPASFPRVERDLAFTIDEKVAYEEIERALKKADALIKDVNVFDVYQGAGVEEGKKSLAIRMTLLSEDHTLKDEESASVMKKAIEIMRVKFGAEIRG
jgi:phenylalanyl-tRNA synthetase beta chain